VFSKPTLFVTSQIITIFRHMKILFMKSYAHCNTYYKDRRQYEIKNHLGNVRATVTDRRLPAFDNGTIADFRTEVDQWGDYYAFG